MKNVREGVFMDQKKKIQEAVYLAIDKVNEQLESEESILKTPETILIGEKGVLDSLSFVTLITALETQMRKTFDSYFVLPIAFQIESPMTIDGLIDYVDKLLENK